MPPSSQLQTTVLVDLEKVLEQSVVSRGGRLSATVQRQDLLRLLDGRDDFGQLGVPLRISHS